MQSSPWMQTALLPSEAVLLPALPRVTTGRTHAPERLRAYEDNADAFRPLSQGCDACGTTNALAAGENAFQPVASNADTASASRGSMAGRGVLRAVGVSCGTTAAAGRPAYAPERRSLRLTRWRQG